MIEVVLTCLLFSGGSWTPPPEWTVQEIFLSGPSYITLTVPNSGERICPNWQHGATCDEPRGSVRLFRAFKPGDQIKLPRDCTMEVKK